MKRSAQRGYTLVELMVVIGILLVVMGFLTINLLRSQEKASVTATINILESALREQQMKAMSGDTEGRSTASEYGVKFFSDRYVLFHGVSYDPSDAANFPTILEGTLQFATTLTNNEVIFSRGSGEVVGGQGGDITLQSGSQNEQAILHLNKYGVVSGLD
jgi:prepilin-type N-terminal cleavage/methylation domain-containing protein